MSKTYCRQESWVAQRIRKGPTFLSFSLVHHIVTLIDYAQFGTLFLSRIRLDEWVKMDVSYTFLLMPHAHRGVCALECWCILIHCVLKHCQWAAFLLQQSKPRALQPPRSRAGTTRRNGGHLRTICQKSYP